MMKRRIYYPDQRLAQPRRPRTKYFTQSTKQKTHKIKSGINDGPNYTANWLTIDGWLKKINCVCST